MPHPPHSSPFPSTTLFRPLVLVVRPRVRDGAATRLHVRDAVLDDDGADADAGVELAVVGEPADRAAVRPALDGLELVKRDRKSTRLNSSHMSTSYAVFCLK